MTCRAAAGLQTRRWRRRSCRSRWQGGKRPLDPAPPLRWCSTARCQPAAAASACCAPQVRPHHKDLVSLAEIVSLHRLHTCTHAAICQWVPAKTHLPHLSERHDVVSACLVSAGVRLARQMAWPERVGTLCTLGLWPLALHLALQVTSDSRIHDPQDKGPKKQVITARWAVTSLSRPGAAGDQRCSVLSNSRGCRAYVAADWRTNFNMMLACSAPRRVVALSKLLHRFDIKRVSDSVLCMPAVARGCHCGGRRGCRAGGGRPEEGAAGARGQRARGRLAAGRPPRHHSRTGACQHPDSIRMAFGWHLDLFLGNFW